MVTFKETVGDERFLFMLEIVSLVLVCEVGLSSIFLWGRAFWKLRKHNDKYNLRSAVTKFANVITTGILIIVIHSQFIVTEFDMSDGWVWLLTMAEFQMIFVWVTQPPSVAFMNFQKKEDFESSDNHSFGSMPILRVISHVVALSVTMIYFYFIVVISTILPLLENDFNVIYNNSDTVVFLVILSFDIMLGLYDLIDNLMNFQGLRLITFNTMQSVMLLTNLANFILYFWQSEDGFAFPYIIFSYHILIGVAYGHMLGFKLDKEIFVKCLVNRCGKNETSEQISGSIQNSDNKQKSVSVMAVSLAVDNDDKNNGNNQNGIKVPQTSVEMTTKVETRIRMHSATENREFLGEKWTNTVVTVIGDERIGKTRFLRSVVSQKPDDRQMDDDILVNVSDDVFYDEYHLNQRYFYVNRPSKSKVIFWDTVGDTRFHRSTFQCIEQSNIVMAMYFLDNKKSEEPKVQYSLQFIKDLDKKFDKFLNEETKIPCLLVGITDNDQEEREQLKLHHLNQLRHLRQECKHFKFVNFDVNDGLNDEHFIFSFHWWANEASIVSNHVAKNNDDAGNGKAPSDVKKTILSDQEYQQMPMEELNEEMNLWHSLHHFRKVIEKCCQFSDKKVLKKNKKCSQRCMDLTKKKKSGKVKTCLLLRNIPKHDRYYIHDPHDPDNITENIHQSSDNIVQNMKIKIDNTNKRDNDIMENAMSGFGDDDNDHLKPGPDNKDNKDNKEDDGLESGSISRLMTSASYHNDALSLDLPQSPQSPQLPQSHDEPSFKLLSIYWSVHRWQRIRPLRCPFLFYVLVSFVVGFIGVVLSPFVLLVQSCLFWLYSDSQQAFSNEFVSFVLKHVNVPIHNGIAYLDYFFALFPSFFPDPEIRHLIDKLAKGAFGQTKCSTCMGFVYVTKLKYKVYRILLSFLLILLVTMSIFNVIFWHNHYNQGRYTNKISQIELVSGPIWLCAIGSLIGCWYCYQVIVLPRTNSFAASLESRTMQLKYSDTENANSGLSTTNIAIFLKNWNYHYTAKRLAKPFYKHPATVLGILLGITFAFEPGIVRLMLGEPFLTDETAIATIFGIILNCFFSVASQLVFAMCVYERLKDHCNLVRQITEIIEIPNKDSPNINRHIQGDEKVAKTVNKAAMSHAGSCARLNPNVRCYASPMATTRNVNINQRVGRANTTVASSGLSKGGNGGRSIGGQGSTPSSPRGMQKAMTHFEIDEKDDTGGVSSTNINVALQLNDVPSTKMQSHQSASYKKAGAIITKQSTIYSSNRRKESIIDQRHVKYMGYAIGGCFTSVCTGICNQINRVFCILLCCCCAGCDSESDDIADRDRDRDFDDDNANGKFKKHKKQASHIGIDDFNYEELARESDFRFGSEFVSFDDPENAVSWMEIRDLSFLQGMQLFGDLEAIMACLVFFMVLAALYICHDLLFSDGLTGETRLARLFLFFISVLWSCEVLFLGLKFDKLQSRQVDAISNQRRCILLTYQDTREIIGRGTWVCLQCHKWDKFHTMIRSKFLNIDAALGHEIHCHAMNNINDNNKNNNKKNNNNNNNINCSCQRVKQKKWTEKEIMYEQWKFDQHCSTLQFFTEQLEARPINPKLFGVGLTGTILRTLVASVMTPFVIFLFRNWA